MNKINLNKKSENKVNLKPLGDRVLVKPSSDADSQKTVSGLYIPETVSKEKPEQGKGNRDWRREI